VRFAEEPPRGSPCRMATAARDNSRAGSVAQTVHALRPVCAAGRRPQAGPTGGPATAMAPLRPAPAAGCSWPVRPGPGRRTGQARRAASGSLGAGAARASALPAAPDTVSAQAPQTGSNTASASSPSADLGTASTSGPPAAPRTCSAPSPPAGPHAPSTSDPSAGPGTPSASGPPAAAEHATVAAHTRRHRRWDPNSDAVVRVGQLHRAVHLPGRAQ